MVGALALSLTGAAFADDGLAARTGPAQDGEPAVSTSPELSPARGSLEIADPSLAAAPRPALTRAASRHRVETMSPLGWLERFGPVEVGQSDATRR